MKILIWVGCLLANSVIVTLLKMNGILLGAIPVALLYVAFIGLATFLSSLVGKGPSKKKEAEIRDRVLSGQTNYLRKKDDETN